MTRTGLALIHWSDPQPRSLEWLEQHHVVWNQNSDERPSIIIGVYRRASTMGQIGGYRQTTMVDDMTEVVLRKGPAYGVIVFDEGHKSGTTLSGRAVARRMIAAHESGAIQGIAAPDVKRLCRDEWLGGGREMARALRKHRGLLILNRGEVLDLRQRFHLKAFMHELKQASDEIGEITYTMYSGMVARARLTAEGKVEPMYRGPAPYGYHHVDCVDEHGQLIRSRNTVRRTLAKNPAHAAGMRLMVELLNSERSLNTAARKLNAAAVGADIHLGEFSQGWTGDRLRGLLRNPTFYGQWVPVRERKSDIWDDFDEVDVVVQVPDLAYWSETAARAWLEKFTPAVARRERVHDRPFAGILRCEMCRGPMISSGYHGYRCRAANAAKQGRPSSCANPQTIAHQSVAGVLRGLFQANIDQAADLIVARHQQQKLEAASDPIADELAVLDQQEAGLLDLAMGRKMSDQMRVRYEWIQAERERLKEKQVKTPALVRLTDDQVALATLLRHDGLAFYDRMTSGQQAEAWRLLGRHVVVYHVGGRGATVKHRAEIVGAESANEGDIWIVQSYLTQLGGVA